MTCQYGIDCEKSVCCNAHAVRFVAAGATKIWTNTAHWADNIKVKSYFDGGYAARFFSAIGI